MLAQNLPSFPRPFIGREQELTELVNLFANPDCRLLTLTGPGGIGKTRLALEVAKSLHKHFSDGICFVPLQSVTSSDFIIPAIAEALHSTFQGTLDPKQQILGYLREKHLLLLLDNFEHLMEGVDLLPEILEIARNVKILVTSRERLHLREEWLFDVDGLTYPDNIRIRGWHDFTAVQLFLHSARRDGYAPTEADTAPIVHICQMVEGIPLAIELAAAWVRVMPCAEIAREVAHSLDILTTTIHNVPEKHRSMRAAFERSWDLLTDEEQAVFRKVSVFRGGFTREGAEQVAGATLAILASLVDKSLVQVNASGRYDLHELLRQYAAAKLRDAGEENILIQRHGDYFLYLAERAEFHAFGREQVTWFDRIEADLDNLRVALTRWEEDVTGLRLAAALGWFFSERTYWNEGLDWLQRLLTANPAAPVSLRAKALHSAGALAGLLEDEPHTRTLCEQALALARTVDDCWNIAWALGHLGNYIISDADESAALLEESLALFRELGDTMGIAHILCRRAWKAIQEQRDYAYGRVLLEEAAILTHEAGDLVLTAWIQYFMGLIACLQDNDLLQARICFESSMLLFREARCPFHEPVILLADVEQAMGNAARAQRLYEESLTWLRQNIIIHPYLSWVVAGLVSVAISLGQPERAARLLGAANRIGLDAKRNSPDVNNFGSGVAAVAAVRDQLGETAFAEAWAAGNVMTPAQIIAYALQGRTTTVALSAIEHANHPDTLHPASQSLPEPLNARELEVLSLVASGLSNREIAEQLFVTVNTVKWYLKGIFGKLQVANRIQAVARAQALGLLSPK